MKALLLLLFGLVSVLSQTPDWSYVPSHWVIPGMDFLGSGFDARQFDTFHCLMPQFFMWSFNDNPRGYENLYRYPLDFVSYAVPDQVAVRTLSKTSTKAYTFDSTADQITQLYLQAGVTGNFPNISGQFQISYNNIKEGTQDAHISQQLLTYELYQLYVAQRYTNPSLTNAIQQLDLTNFQNSPNLYYDFVNGWGTHYIDSITVGGSISQSTKMTNVNSTQYQAIQVALQGKFTGSIGSIQGNLSLSDTSLQTTINEQLTSDAETYGGAVDFTNFAISGGVDYNAVAALFQSWKETIMANPIMVRYRLVETWTLLGTQESRYEMCLAIAQELGFNSVDQVTHCQGTDFMQQGDNRFGIGFFENQS